MHEEDEISQTKTMLQSFISKSSSSYSSCLDTLIDGVKIVSDNEETREDSDS